MKAVILAGGFGTRLAEETALKPKPLVPIGDMPILWHIMKIYSHHGVNDFIVCLGYKGELIREFFLNYSLMRSDVTVDIGKNSFEVQQHRSENWRVTLADTGADSMTGGRIKIASKYLQDDDTFCMTYGDGVGNVDITKLIAFHKRHGKEATVTSVTPPGRFGVLDISGENQVLGFREKIASDQYQINAGFFILSASTIDRIDDAKTVFEKKPMESLARDGQLMSFAHSGFWQPMDTLRDKIRLEELWASGDAPWAVWL